ncbi:hypothetical protein ACVWW6_002227 [Bradyrhizobium sp. USDA 3311]
MPELAISAEKVAFIIEKAREFDVKEAASDPDSGSNPSDDDGIDVLEDTASDPVASELTGFIGALNEDEQLDLVTLMWIGRGDGSVDEWDDLRARAAEAAPNTRRPGVKLCNICWASRCWAICWPTVSTNSASTGPMSASLPIPPVPANGTRMSRRNGDE